MRKALVVAHSELNAAVRSKAFLFTLALMPVLMGGSILLQTSLAKHVDAKPRACAVIDETGKIYDGLAAKTEARNQVVAGGGGKEATGAVYTLERVDATGKDLNDLRVELSDRIRKKELFAFVEIPVDAMDGAAGGGLPSLRYYSDDPSYLDLVMWLQAATSDELRAQRLRAVGADPELVARLSTPVGADTLGLWERAADGTVKPATPVDKLRTFAVPMILMLLIYMVVMTSAPQLLNSVLEEKMSRISEVLLGSVTPFELMMGKLIGATGVALILAGLYAGGGLGAAYYLGHGMVVPLAMLPWLALFLVLALFFFGSFYIAIGAACSELKDAQSLMMPVMLMTVFPVMMASAVMREPNGPMATAASMVPPATPFLMLLRMAMHPGPPAWQVAVSVIVTLAATVGCVFAAGKIFRVGVLSQGKSATFAQMVKWVLAK